MCVWVCACVRGCVFLVQGVHGSGHGLILPVGDGGSCEVRTAREGWSCCLSDWPGWLLLGNPQALRCHGAWKRGMSHSSLPTGLRETSSLSPGPGFTRSHKEALPKFLPFSGRPAALSVGAARGCAKGAAQLGPSPHRRQLVCGHPHRTLPGLHWSASSALSAPLFESMLCSLCLVSSLSPPPKGP